MTKSKKFDFYCEEVFSGKTKVEKLYESDEVIAFYHTKPSYETHIVIAPKEHIQDLISISKQQREILIEILEISKQLASKLDIENNDARLITNMGKFQDSPHLHFHLISGEKI